MNKDKKAKDNKQKPKDACPARTTADKRTAAEDNNVMPCLQQYLCWWQAMSLKAVLRNTYCVHKR